MPPGDATAQSTPTSSTCTPARLPIYGNAPAPKRGNAALCVPQGQLRPRRRTQLPARSAGAVLAEHGRPKATAVRWSIWRRKPTMTTNRRAMPASSACSRSPATTPIPSTASGRQDAAALDAIFQRPQTVDNTAVRPNSSISLMAAREPTGAASPGVTKRPVGDGRARCRTTEASSPAAGTASSPGKCLRPDLAAGRTGSTAMARRSARRALRADNGRPGAATSCVREIANSSSATTGLPGIGLDTTGFATIDHPRRPDHCSVHGAICQTPDAKAPRNFSSVETWVFDLDNTLYPHDLNLWQQVDERSATTFGVSQGPPRGSVRVQKDYTGATARRCAG